MNLNDLFSIIEHTVDKHMDTLGIVAQLVSTDGSELVNCCCCCCCV